MIRSLKKMLKCRRVRKKAAEVLRHARHVKNYNEDIAPANLLSELDKSVANLSRELKGDINLPALEASAVELLALTDRIVPERSFRGLRENLEVILVAIVVAMGIRTYIIQPFKIPTGSMQPTLYGIHGIDMQKPGITDKFPLNIARWIITGERYREVRVSASGRLLIQPTTSKPGLIECHVGPRAYFVPRSERLLEMSGRVLSTGDLLWSGRQKSGDHVFVNKVIWNFQRPKRGDVMVFSTEGITDLEQDFPRDKKGRPLSTHYIKRMCGVPGDTLSIEPPNILLNGYPLTEPDSIARVASARDGYSGYTPANFPGVPLGSSHDQIKLGENQYLALGDNTTNSRDSRYWGPVPERNLIGPAFMVYWPYTKGRWGLIQGH